ncbi:hypothetical protein [Methanosarcina horonobensis]|uniref:hypothetical protein n=1 Tax=Methanosarcina horonobensis TaxID=418008 RepID=UPI0022B93355|nr:hypothetical protein [Methanosarcina horonobensis]
MSYPYKPAATPEMGVGVRPSTGSMMAATLASKYPQYKTGGEKKRQKTNPQLTNSNPQ